jgi:ribosome biogenesis protein MAK21
MKGVVINELNLFLHRANLSGRAQYYAIVFLNQLLFVAGSPSDEALAQRLIKLYFSLFQSQVSMISSEKEERETNTKAKRREIINKLRNLEQQGKSSKGGKKDSKDKKDKTQDKEKQQLTTALKSLRRGADDARAEIESNHAKLMGALLAGVNRAYPYANFNDDEFEHHATELFRIVHGHNFNLAVQALQFLFQVMRSRATLSDRFYRALYEKLMTVEARTSGKHALFLNLLFKSMKHDTSIPRITAFLKRLLQVCLHAATSFVCGSLILAGEIVRLHPEVRERIVSVQPKAPENVDERDAHGYDASKRDPIHANANLSCLWELNQLKDHFHPSVSHFAKCIIDGQAIEYLGDPLADFTTIAFLDRFMYKNPKQLDKESGGVMALRARRAARPQLFAAHSAQYLTLHPSLIPEDERFLRQYFESKAARDTGTQVKEKRLDGDFDFDGDEDPEEAAFANALMEKEMQKMHGKFDDDEDDDIDYEDALGSQESSDDEGLGDDIDGEDDDEVTFPKYIKTGAGDVESDSDMSDLPDGDSDDDNEDDEGVDTIMLSDDDEAAAMAEAGLDDDISMKALKKNKKRKQQESDDDSEDDALRRAFDQDDDSDDAFNSKPKKGKKKGKAAGSDDEEEYQSVDRKNKKKKASSSFADADEFAALLDGGGASAGDMKHSAWERKKEFGGHAKRGRGGRGGGRSFRK